MIVDDAIPMLRRRHVLITGGLGFIGSHTADAFLEAGWAVTLIDSMAAAVVDGAHYAGDVTVVRRSVEEFLADDRGLEAYDLVVHAASHVGPAGILRYTGRLGFEIAHPTHLVIEACLAAGCPLVTFSSAEVYGRSGRLAESDAIIVPTAYSARIEYAIAKTLCEAMTLNSRRRGLRGIVVRPFNVTGSRQSSAGGFVLPTFVQQALAGEPLTVFAGGGQTRSFMSVTDLSRFLVDHLDQALADGHAIVNLGNPGNTISILELAHRVKALVGGASPVRLVDAKKIHGDLYEEAASVDKVPVLGAARAVGWEPRVDLDSLIEETIAFYRAHRDLRADAAA